MLVRGYDNSKAAGDKKVCPTLKGREGKGRGRNYRAGKVESGDAVTSEIVVVVQHGVEEGKNRVPNYQIILNIPKCVNCYKDGKKDKHATNHP